MTRSRTIALTWRLSWLIGLAALAGCDEPTPALDLQAELARARPGDVVTVQAGSYDGPLTIPAGVTVRVAPGAAADIVQSTPGAAVTVLSEAGSTSCAASRWT
jgi:hypothetical protein